MVYHTEHERSKEEAEALAESLREEIAKRRLGHEFGKRPLGAKAYLSDIKDSNLHSKEGTQVFDIVYDDMSADRVHYKQDSDKLVETTISFPQPEADDDGVLRTFIDRYTALITHESAYMEEIPAPQFMHQSLLMHPLVAHGNLELNDDKEPSSTSKSDSEWPTKAHQHITSAPLPDLATLLTQAVQHIGKAEAHQSAA